MGHFELEKKESIRKTHFQFLTELLNSTLSFDDGWKSFILYGPVTCKDTSCFQSFQALLAFFFFKSKRLTAPASGSAGFSKGLKAKVLVVFQNSSPLTGSSNNTKHVKEPSYPTLNTSPLSAICDKEVPPAVEILSVKWSLSFIS